MEKEIVTAFTEGYHVIEFDNVAAVDDTSGEGYKAIEIHIHGKREPLALTNGDALIFVEKYKDYIYLKQQALGIEIENKPEGGDNGK